MESLWYKDAVMYELPVQAFCNSDGDGNGDCPGVIQKLNYLRDLGVSAISLLPFYPSPPQGDGSGLAHYESVDPRYGALGDFQTLLHEAQTQGMPVLIEHRLFHYGPNADVDRAYLRRAQLRVVRHWLDMGVDGLRLGATPDAAERNRAGREDLPKAHEILKDIRRVIDERYPGRVLVADENLCQEDVVAYFGDGDECHMAFNMALTPRVFMAVKQGNRRAVVDTLRQMPEIPAICQWAVFLRNHDELRPENDRRRLELSYGLLLSLPGTPVIYYGNEIGTGDNVFTTGDSAVWMPMQWSGARHAGFSIWMRRVIAVRKQHKALAQGTIEFVEQRNERVLAYIRASGHQRILVVANLSGSPQSAEFPLRLYAGVQPVEMLGGRAFPRVRSVPYSLTLAPYGLYWLTLDRPSREVVRSDPDIGAVGRGIASIDAPGSPA